MNVMNYLDYMSPYYNSISELRNMVPVQENTEIPAEEKSTDSALQHDKNSGSSEHDRGEVIDYAVNSHMRADPELLGSGSSIESLDITKAISDMQKDSILREYQKFVQNPQDDIREFEEGVVIRKQ